MIQGSGISLTFGLLSKKCELFGLTLSFINQLPGFKV